MQTVRYNQVESATLTKSTLCVAPIPIAIIDAEMETQTVNRYIRFDNQRSYSSEGFPILHHLDEWEIEPLDGQTDYYFGNAAGYASVPTQTGVMYLQSKQIGSFKVRGRVTNAYTAGPWYEITVHIVPDTMPFIRLTGLDRVYRDPDTKQANIHLHYQARTPQPTDALRE